MLDLINLEQLPNNMELYAIYVYNIDSVQCLLGEVFKVEGFVRELGFYPFGVRLMDNKGKRVNGIHYIQQFDYLVVCMN